MSEVGGVVLRYSSINLRTPLLTLSSAKLVRIHGSKGSYDENNTYAPFLTSYSLKLTLTS